MFGNFFGSEVKKIVAKDRACVNKDEAEQYFERNLSIEVKVLNEFSCIEVHIYLL